MLPHGGHSMVTGYAAMPMQTGPAGAQAAPANSGAAMPIDSLSSALHQTAAVLDQVNVSRWRVSKGWKRQLQDDVASIQQDISTQLPGLFEKAHASPKLIGPQLAAMQNVDALYDVLVRVSTAANLSGNKGDASALDGALQQLESSRKAASQQLQQAASLQDQQLAGFQALIQKANEQNAAEDHAKTIVVNNDGGRRAKRRKAVRHKKSPPLAAQPAPKPASPD